MLPPSEQWAFVWPSTSEQTQPLTDMVHSGTCFMKTELLQENKATIQNF